MNRWKEYEKYIEGIEMESITTITINAGTRSQVERTGREDSL